MLKHAPKEVRKAFKKGLRKDGTFTKISETIMKDWLFKELKKGAKELEKFRKTLK